MSEEYDGPTDRFERYMRVGASHLRLSGFRKFILRGNVVDLASGVVIGAAFTAVVTSVVKDFLTPLITAAFGGHTTCTTSTTGAVTCTNSFADRYFTVRGAHFVWGDLINSVLTLLLVGVALYYFVVIPVNHLMERFKPETEPGKRTKVCPECKSSIPYDATRCAFCTVEQPPLQEAQLTGSHN